MVDDTTLYDSDIEDHPIRRCRAELLMLMLLLMLLLLFTLLTLTCAERNRMQPRIHSSFVHLWGCVVCDCTTEWICDRYSYAMPLGALILSCVPAIYSLLLSRTGIFALMSGERERERDEMGWCSAVTRLLLYMLFFFAATFFR